MFASKDVFLTPPSTGGYTISRSVRLRSSASAYFNRTPASAGSGTTWTWNAWVKLGSFGTSQATLLSAGANANANRLTFYYNSNTLGVDANGAQVFTTSAVYRDPSAFYMVTLVWDTTQATASNRVKLYVNGLQVTAFSLSSYPAQNATSTVNTTAQHFIGCDTYNNARFYDGYLTEINFIDGQALTPSSFGSTNAITGVWQPAKYTGTYGTNGFYLNFSDNSNNTATTIGKDYSGNGNNWTPNNISVTSGVTYDSMIDVPTPYADGGNGRGNYCVMNPLSANQMASGTVSVTNGNLTVSDGATSYGVGAQGTIAVTSGKWYWEVTATTVGGNYGGCGIRLSTLNAATDGSGYFYYSDGTKTTSVFGGGSAYGASYTSGDVIGVALDMDGGTITFYKNNTSQGTAYTGLSGSFNACVGDGQNATQYVWNANFGQRPFTYTPPSGYVALNTYNLPAGTITTSGTFIGNASTDGPFVYLNGVPTAMTINGNAVTFGTNADHLANGFKVRSSSASYNASGSNTYSITTTGAKFKNAIAQTNP